MTNITNAWEPKINLVIRRSKLFTIIHTTTRRWSLLIILKLISFNMMMADTELLSDELQVFVVQRDRKGRKKNIVTRTFY